MPVQIYIQVHLAVELILLIILASNFALRLVWLKPQIFFASRAAFLVNVSTQMTGVYTSYLNSAMLIIDVMEKLIFATYISLPDDCPLCHVL